jgi:major membrane immunogen (membrane-anchored lipoprotein)
LPYKIYKIFNNIYRRKYMKKLTFIVLAAVIILSACGNNDATVETTSEVASDAIAETATATKYYVAHQGGYIGEATVTVGADNEVVSASMSEWMGPGGWVEYNSEDGKSLVDGAVVRVPDPLANTGHPNPQVKGYMFYIYNARDGVAAWSQYSPTNDGFARPTRMYERDFEGLMSNPIRAKAYVEAAREDTLVNVTIDGNRVNVGKPASETVHYGHMDKANPNSTYMSISGHSIGYRFNNEALIEFFKENPAADYTNTTLVERKVELAADPAVDATGDISAYAQDTDRLFAVADAVSGATYSDFPHYAIELQEAYKAAVAARYVNFD